MHPWMVVFDLHMAREVFNILHKDILGLRRYGLEVEEKPGSVTITFSSLRRLCHLFANLWTVVDLSSSLAKDRVKPSSLSATKKKRSDDLQYKNRVFGSKILLWLLEFVWYQPTLNTEIRHFGN